MFKKTDSRGTHSSTTASDDPEKQTEPLLPRDLPRTDGASSGGGTGALVDAGGPRGVPQWVLTVSYGLTNLSSVVMIVVANKMVLYTCKFSFVVTLTLLHSVFTYVGMGLMAMLGLFPVKAVAARHSVQIAAVYVGERHMAAREPLGQGRQSCRPRRATRRECQLLVAAVLRA
jgi:hypothetical protein